MGVLGAEPDNQAYRQSMDCLKIFAERRSFCNFAFGAQSCPSDVNIDQPLLAEASRPSENAEKPTD
jgi:hypothetical protein